MNQVDFIYLNLCEQLLYADQVAGTREMNNVKIELDASKNTIVGVRGISPSYLLGEWLWYFTGRHDVKFISQFGSMWEKLSDDGITNNSAYGYLMRYAFGFDQIEKMIDLLTLDPNSRRAVVNLNTPNEKVIETHDEPCTIALQYLIRDGKLNCTGIMRSNDIWFGLPYDIAFFTELQRYIAYRLDIPVGSYTHFVTSMHLYDKDYETVKKIVSDREYKGYEYDRIELYKNSYWLAQAVEDDIKKNKPKLCIRHDLLARAKDLIDFREVKDGSEY